MQEEGSMTMESHVVCQLETGADYNSYTQPRHI